MHDFKHMSVPELEAHLLNLWDKADTLSMDSEEYKKIVDEVLAIRLYTYENHVSLSDEVAGRF